MYEAHIIELLSKSCNLLVCRKLLSFEDGNVAMLTKEDGRGKEAKTQY
jgi:hypothetical protein